MSRRPSAAWATIAGCLLGAVASLAVNLTAAAESPDYTARPDQLVTFGSSDRLGNPLTLTAILTKPEGEHRFPAVVVLHGCDGIWLRWDYSWRRRLIDWGYAVLSVDSFSPRGHGNLCTSPGAQMSMDRVGDAHAARAFLAGLPFVNPSRIAVMGMSAGGTAAILSILAPEEPRANPFQAAVALYPACGRALEDRDAPLLVLIAQFDDWMPSRQCLAMRAEGDSPHPSRDGERASRGHPYSMSRGSTRTSATAGYATTQEPPRTRHGKSGRSLPSTCVSGPASRCRPRRTR